MLTSIRQSQVNNTFYVENKITKMASYKRNVHSYFMSVLIIYQCICCVKDNSFFKSKSNKSLASNIVVIAICVSYTYSYRFRHITFACFAAPAYVQGVLQITQSVGIDNG